MTTFPMIENLTALVDAVWVYSSRTLDTATPAASNGSYLDDIGYATWTYTERSVINPPPVPITAISAILLGGDGITTTRVVQLACGGITAGHRRLRVNGGSLAFPSAPTNTPQVPFVGALMLPDVQFLYDQSTYPPGSIVKTESWGITGMQPMPGTLLHHVYWGQKQFLEGAQSSLFSVKNHTTQTYVRRTDTLVGAHDLSCVSVWNSRFQERAGHIAITQRHCACGNHFACSVNDTLRFVDMQNQVVERTVAAREHLFDFGGEIDACIITLDEDLPDSIVPAVFPPSDLYSYMTWGFPGRTFYSLQDQAELEIYTSLNPEFLDYMVPTSHYPFLFRRQGNQISAVALYNDRLRPDRVNEHQLKWYTGGGFTHSIVEFVPLHQPIITFDSGGPLFVIVNGRVMLCSTALSPGSGPRFHTERSLYEARTGRSIAVADLTMFVKIPTGYE